MIVPLAHVAGVPAEEALPALLPALAACGALALGRVHAAWRRLRRSARDHER
jgi:hypothetical protein